MLRTSVVTMTLALVSFGCGGGSPSSPSGTSGTLSLRITDSPFTDAKAVLVTFSEVTAHRTEASWSKVPFADAAATSRTCDLKRLEGSAQDLLGSGPLTAGQYTMVRLVVQSARIYFDNPSTSVTPCATTITAPEGRSASVNISSGEVKLNRGFTLAADGTTTILLDFDGNRSIQETGNGLFMMNPVIGIVSVQ
jgi:Domain of unknown function (DUF4382)